MGIFVCQTSCHASQSRPCFSLQISPAKQNKQSKSSQAFRFVCKRAGRCTQRRAQWFPLPAMTRGRLRTESTGIGFGQAAAIDPNADGV